MGLEGNKGDRTYFFLILIISVLLYFQQEGVTFVTLKYKNFFFIKLLNFVMGYSQLDVVIVSGRQESEGTRPYIYIHPLSCKLFSHSGCHMTLNTGPCSIQESLAGYPF